MKQFSLSRTLRIIKANIACERRAILIEGLAFTAATVLAEFATLGNSIVAAVSLKKLGIPTGGAFAYSAHNVETLLSSMFVITIAVLASRSFANLRTKQQRVAFFMLPATTAEKFTARTVFSVVLYGAMALVGIIVGDAIRTGIFAYEGFDLGFANIGNAIFGFDAFWGGMSLGDALLKAEEVAWQYLFPWTTCLLASAVFRKLAFLKWLCVLTVCIIGILLFTNQWYVQIIEFLDHRNASLMSLGGFCFVAYAVNIGVVAASYFVFKRIAVDERSLLGIKY